MVTEPGPVAPVSLIIASDFVCPWCYAGLVEVEKLRREYDVTIRFAPFLLDPSTPPEGKPRRSQTQPGDPPTPLEERGLQGGLTFTRGRTWSSNSHLAHEAAEFAAEHGDPLAFHWRMFRAYFEELVDVGKADNVVQLGAAAGLDPDALRRALESGEYRQAVDDGLRWCQEAGISSVPTFVFDERLGISGAQEYAVFQSVMERLGRTPRANGG